MVDNTNIRRLAAQYGLEPAVVSAIMEVESSGNGFDAATGRMKIQFEPAWFKKYCTDWRNHIAGHIWHNNKVEGQHAEWRAFNDAYGINKEAALMSTSIGLMQVMGFNYKVCGFDKVGTMWDYAKMGESFQLEIGLLFITANSKLKRAAQLKDWQTFAYYYNGSNYKVNNYDKRLETAYKRHFDAAQ